MCIKHGRCDCFALALMEEVMWIVSRLLKIVSI